MEIDSKSSNPRTNFISSSVEVGDATSSEILDTHEQLRQVLEVVKDVEISSRVQQRQRRKTFWVSAKEHVDEVHDDHGAHSVRGKLVSFLHSHRVQLILTIFLILDVVLVMSDLFIEAHFPPCIYVVRDGTSCCPGDSPHRNLLGHGHDAISCPSGSHASTEFQVLCSEHKRSGIHVLHTVLASISIGILMTFLIELLLLLVALGVERFVEHILYVVDLVIVAVSLAIEICIISGTIQTSVAELIILVRLWRLVRIGHGLVTTGTDFSEDKVHGLEHHLKELEEIIEALPGGREVMKSRLETKKKEENQKHHLERVPTSDLPPSPMAGHRRKNHDDV
eukprot:g415.t1